VSRGLERLARLLGSLEAWCTWIDAAAEDQRAAAVRIGEVDDLQQSSNSRRRDARIARRCGSRPNLACASEHYRSASKAVTPNGPIGPFNGVGSDEARVSVAAPT
jgi:hypothetical protein